MPVGLFGLPAVRPAPRQDRDVSRGERLTFAFSAGEKPSVSGNPGDGVGLALASKLALLNPADGLSAWGICRGAQAIRAATLTDTAFQRCIRPACAATYAIDEVRVACQTCGSLLDVVYDWDRLNPPRELSFFESKWSQRYEPLALSGVWRFYELLPFAPRDRVVTIGEGQTLLQSAPPVAKYVGLKGSGKLMLEYEGMNPSGSFKDNGMSAAFTHARAIGAKRAACASTGDRKSVV